MLDDDIKCELLHIQFHSALNSQTCIKFFPQLKKYLSSAMEKKIKDLSSWIEVTPALFISLRKTSNSPALETITEEEAEGREDDD
ncbi:hypothetical protein DKX38_009714 [Salix brachista]|uniref:Uncharacterized protein n=1 Tax=Salix brachista TaxID=2182728 RepID=A0A5N5MDQ3_9ROSI|nr:hypothetical protein DKX38_009714 [Salix brachista]